MKRNQLVAILAVMLLQQTHGDWLPKFSPRKKRSKETAAVHTQKTLPVLANAIETVGKYYRDGEYESDILRIANHAQAQLAEENPDANKVVVFDIDDTLLSNERVLAPMLARGCYCRYGARKEFMGEHRPDMTNLPAIGTMKQLYDWIKDRGYTIFLITNRGENASQETEENLKRRDITGYKGIYFRPKGDTDAADVYKNEARKSITDSGYQIVASFGDQLTDLAGSNTGLCFKLPNYLYENKLSGKLALPPIYS